MEENYITFQRFIRVVVKEPYKDPEIKTIKNDYKRMSEFLGGMMDITEFPLDETIDVMVNDESLLNGMEPNVIVPEIEGVWAGPIIFAGYEPETGESISLNDRQIEKVLEYIKENVSRDQTISEAYLHSKDKSLQLKY